MIIQGGFVIEHFQGLPNRPTCPPAGHPSLMIALYGTLTKTPSYPLPYVLAEQGFHFLDIGILKEYDFVDIIQMKNLVTPENLNRNEFE